MAEGVEVEIPRATTQKYFCHSCVREVTARFPDLKCTQCQSDFIEEVPDYHDGSDDSDLDLEPLQDLPWLVHEYPFRHLIRRTILQTLFDFDQREAENFPTRAILGEWLRSRRSRGEGSISSMRSDDDDDDDHGVNFFSEILLDSNLGDYAFGVEWDSIITQILNESDVSGPPPLPRQQIESIPLVSVLEDHVNKGLQCTVCMEDFKLNEQVKNLPCEHMFHPECIVPWLKMHATCPICRKQIDAEEETNCLNGDGLSDSSSSTSTNSDSTSSTNSTSSSNTTTSSFQSTESATDTSTNSETTTEASSSSRRSSNSSLELGHRLIYPFLFHDA